jgi:hypothetical protein
MNISQKLTQTKDVDRSLMDIFLEPYKDSCKYLKKARFQYLDRDEWTDKSRTEDLSWSMKGEFSIPESCYIDDTGHFNSVEFNICYNQLFYVTIAHLISNKLLKVMQDWNLETYKRRQLSDFLIVKFSSTFRKQINSDRFEGSLSFNKQSVRGNLIMLKTTCSFCDHNDGLSEGEITIAILNSKAEKKAQHYHASASTKA